MDTEYVNATINPPRVWNFYPTLEAAQSDLDRARKGGEAEYAPMTWDEYLQGQKAFYLSDPAQQITREKYHEMLEVLPPVAWKQQGDLQTFLMSEHFSGPFTDQYAALGFGDNQTFWVRMVDVSDRRTWITREELAALR
jgi:hypothetical protein